MSSAGCAIRCRPRRSCWSAKARDRGFADKRRDSARERTTDMDRGATANWNASAGTLTTDSGALINMPFSTIARYELEATPSATTPEELLAAAYAACFTMTLAEHLT